MVTRDRERTARDLAHLLMAFPERVCYGTDSPFYSYNLIVSEAKWLRFVRDTVPPEAISSVLCNRVFSRLG